MIAIMFEALETFARLDARQHLLDEGEILFRMGDPIRSMFVVATGEVRLVRNLSHGAELTLQIADAGSMLAEASMFAAEYHCDAVAAEPSRLLAVPRSELDRLLADDRQLARAWSLHLAREVQRARAQIEIVSLKTVAERLDAWLMLRGPELPAKGEWRRLASEISVSPEALYRELARRR